MKKGLISEIRRMRELMSRLCEGVNDHDVLDKVWISYGTSVFDPDKFKTYDSSFSKEAYKKRIIDRGLEKCIPYSEFMVQRRRDMGNTNKPHFGLWASPVDSERGWRNFCMGGGWNLDNLRDKFLFKLSPDSKIYVIDNTEDLDAISAFGFDNNGWKTIDFRRLLDDGYDGLYITEYATGIHDNSNTMLKGLELWDVESICVFNKDVIIPIDDESLFPDDSDLEFLGQFPSQGLDDLYYLAKILEKDPSQRKDYEQRSVSYLTDSQIEALKKRYGLKESRGNYETWYRGYDSKYGSDV